MVTWGKKRSHIINNWRVNSSYFPCQLEIRRILHHSNKKKNAIKTTIFLLIRNHKKIINNKLILITKYWEVFFFHTRVKRSTTGSRLFLFIYFFNIKQWFSLGEGIEKLKRNLKKKTTEFVILFIYLLLILFWIFVTIVFYAVKSLLIWLNWT